MAIEAKIKYGSSDVTSLTANAPETNILTAGKYCSENIDVELNCSIYEGDIIESISIVTPPTKTSYTVGETLDLTGLVVQDNNGKTITNECTFNPANGAILTSADTSVLVTFSGYEATQSISIILSISVTTPPTKTSYVVGDTLNLDGIVVQDNNSNIVTNACTFIPANGKTLSIGDTPININYKGLSCTQSISIISGYDYGDGTNNTVNRAYEGSIYTNGKTTAWQSVNRTNNSANIQFSTWSFSYSWQTGERYPYNAIKRAQSIASGGTPSTWDQIPLESYNFLDGHLTQLQGFVAGAAGMNQVDFSPSASGEQTIYTEWGYGALTTGIQIGTVKYCLNGVWYTLKEMVDNNICKPLVIIASHGVNGDYYWGNFLNIYNGGTSNTGNYPGGVVLFMLNSGYTLSGLQWYANKARGSTSYNDGLYSVCSIPTDKLRFTLNQY